MKPLQQVTPLEFPTLALVRTGRRMRLIGRVTMFVLISSIIAMVFVPWRQTARGAGIVTALDPQQRPQTVTSPTKGIVDYVMPNLREGTRVKEGDLLMKLAPFAADGVSQLDFQITAIESKEQSAIANLEVARQNVALQRSSGESLIKSLKQELEATRQKWNQAKAAVDQAKADLADKKNKARIARRVAKNGLIPDQELYSSETAVVAAQAKLAEAQNKADEAFATLSGKEEEIESKIQEVEIKNRMANQKELEAIQKVNTIEKELLEAQNKRGELDRLEVHAPRDGLIQQWFGLEGSDTVKEGTALFVLVPDADQLAVELVVTGNDMPLIHVGDPVRLQFEGWPAVQFVGWPSVAKGTFGGSVNRLSPTDDGKGGFKILVTEENHFEGENGWPDDRYLRQGVRTNGWVLLETVPLGYEIWRQLNGFPPTIADPTTGGKKDKPVKVKLPK